MGLSGLISQYIPSSNRSNRLGKKVTKVAVHVTAGTGTAVGTAQYFARIDFASSHYIIDGKGDIVGSVDEDYRAWTTGGSKTYGGYSGSQIDHLAVTIEVANSIAADPWPVTSEAYRKLVDLIEDICRRNDIAECTYKADGSGTLQAHRWYAAKACPGDYLMERFPAIAEEVNSRLKGTSTENHSEEEEEMTKEKFESFMNEYLQGIAKEEGDSWSQEARDWAIKYGIVAGDGKGNYMWRKSVTKQELVQMLFSFSKFLWKGGKT